MYMYVCIKNIDLVTNESAFAFELFLILNDQGRHQNAPDPETGMRSQSFFSPLPS